MWWRALFAAAVVTCTVTLAQGPQPLNQIKDVLCVMLLNSIQKEDLAAITRRLQNENINENNTLPSDIRRIIDLTTNKTDITKRNYMKDNEVGGSRDALLESKERRKNNRTYLNQSTESNLNYERIENKTVENNLQDDEKTNCDVVLDYKNGQPTLLSLFHFWRNCVNMSRPMENNNIEIKLQNNLVSVQNKINSIGGQQNMVPTLHVDAEQSRTDIKRRYDEDATKNQITSKIKPEVQFLQNVYKNYLSSRRKSEESFRSNADTNFNHLNDDSSVEYTISHNESHATNNLVTKTLIAARNEPVSFIYSTEIAKESRSDNNLYYGKYEEHDNLNTKDFYNIEEPPKVYKSGYGNIFYEYNETDGYSFKENPYQFIQMLRSLTKKPSNSFLDNYQLDGNQSELDIKLRKVLRLLENTAVNKVNLDNNIPTKDPVRRHFNTNNQAPTAILDLIDIDSTESTKRYLNMLSTTNIPVVSVPKVHYVNYLPPGNRTINTSDTKYKFTQQRVSMLNNDNIQNVVAKSGETAYSNIPKYIYFYPKNVPLKKVVNNKRIHPYYKDAVGRTYQSNLFEPIKEIKSTSLEVVSVSSIHYVNYLHPEKSIINGVSTSKETDEISKLLPQFSKSYIYSREADEHNYYEYEKVNIIARNHNSHNFKSYHFYPEISQKPLRTEPRLPGIYFTPNVPERGNGQIKEDAYTSETQKQNSVLKNITKNVDAVYSPDGNIMHNVDLDNAANIYKEYTVDTVPCTQKYANATDRRMNSDTKMNEPVIIDENKVLPKHVITNIAESIKTAILEDLRKELKYIDSSTSTTTMRSLPFNITTRGTSSVKIAETTAQIASVTQKIITQETVLEKIMKYLEQMNTSKNGPQNRVNNFQFSNRNIKMLDKDNEKLTTETYLRNLNRQKNYDITYRNYKLAVPRHKKKATVHKDIQGQKKYKLKDKIVEPKTFQTNELQIAPLGVYVDSFVSPINQNIVVSSRDKKRGNNRNTNYYKPLEKKEIDNNPSPPKYRTNIPPPTNYVRTSQQYNVNSYTNYDYQNNHMSEEHKDVKYLDHKFLNKVVKYSTAPKLPSNKDCCDHEYLSQLMYECCNDKVVSRSVEPLVNNEANDGDYRTFIQSQNKVNVMLAKALAARSKFRSVESI